MPHIAAPHARRAHHVSSRPPVDSRAGSRSSRAARQRAAPGPGAPDGAARVSRISSARGSPGRSRRTQSTSSSSDDFHRRPTKSTNASSCSRRPSRRAVNRADIGDHQRATAAWLALSSRVGLIAYVCDDVRAPGTKRAANRRRARTQAHRCQPPPLARPPRRPRRHRVLSGGASSSHGRGRRPLGPDASFAAAIAGLLHSLSVISVDC